LEVYFNQAKTLPRIFCRQSLPQFLFRWIVLNLEVPTRSLKVVIFPLYLRACHLINRQFLKFVLYSYLKLSYGYVDKFLCCSLWKFIFNLFGKNCYWHTFSRTAVNCSNLSGRTTKNTIYIFTDLVLNFETIIKRFLKEDFIFLTLPLSMMKKVNWNLQKIGRKWNGQ